jgi:pimeloyl-ACP methyl ester carboxylesterase
MPTVLTEGEHEHWSVDVPVRQLPHEPAKTRLPIVVDVGTWIGYAYAAEWPDDVKRLAVFDASLSGITPPPPAGVPSAETNVKTWHFAFNRLDDLPEILLHGRERSS